jgi:DNA-binding HxlR family transcriptional regulator
VIRRTSASVAGGHPAASSSGEHPSASSPPTQGQRRQLQASGAALALDLLGDAWVLRLLRSLFRGQRRFSGLIKETGVSRAVLADRLERLCGAGLIRKAESPGRHAQYWLTDCGLDFWRVLLAMWQWESRWGTGLVRPPIPHDRPREEPVHIDCGQVADPRPVCDCCGEVVTAFETRGEITGVTPTSGPLIDSTPAGDTERRFRQSHSARRDDLPTLMRVYGDRWNSSVMAAALQGARTFTDFSEATGIGAGPLTRRLHELQAVGLLRSRAYAGSRSEYRLTSAAVAMFPITLEIIRWGDRWLWQGQPPMTIRHLRCGQAFRLRWQCAHCQQALERTTLRFD